MQILKYGVVGIVGVVVGLLLGGKVATESLGGVYSVTSKYFNDGIVVDTSTLVVDAPNNFVGVGSSTPTRLLSIGTAGATSSVNLGKVCYTVTTSTGGTVFYWYGPSGNVASSTSSCN